MAKVQVDADPNELITIVHPDVGAPGVCTRRQLTEVWADKGWKLQSDNPDDAAAVVAARAEESVI